VLVPQTKRLDFCYRRYRDFESEKVGNRISREASLEASFRGGQRSISGCRAIEEEEEEEEEEGGVYTRLIAFNAAHLKKFILT
jgi:hypothetical protein